MLSLNYSPEEIAQILPLLTDGERAELDTLLFADGEADSDFTQYQYAPNAYIQELLGWAPWQGDGERPGQQEVLDAYVLALRQQHERVAYEAGEISEADLQYWKPGQVIKNRIRIEAGHTIGKTKIASGIVNHFFDCFTPSIVYTYAPSWEQIKDLLWKEISSDRKGKGLPGRILETCEIKHQPDHFAKGRATNNANGQGTERVQGQHGKYLLFVLDEAEGVADFVYDAVDSMASGGIVIVLMLANPRTRTSKFHKAKEHSNVINFRVSCLHHPNVVQNREVVPGAVRRDYVESMIEKHCEEVTEHDPDAHTFEIDWKPGLIYRPDPEFMFRVKGEAPLNSADDTFMPVGRYEAACKRIPDTERFDNTKARMGLDCAGYGNDLGKLYTNHAGAIRMAAEMSKKNGDQDPTDYWQKTRKEALRLKALGVTSLHIRIDAGGGFGNGVYDRLKRDEELAQAFPDFQLFMVHFGGAPHSEKAYADMATEMYAEAAESLRGLAVQKVPEALEADLCERRYKWVNKSGKEVKKLQDKDQFRKKHGRSPDDGDGFVLAAGPDYIFTHGRRVVYSSGS